MDFLKRRKRFVLGFAAGAAGAAAAYYWWMGYYNTKLQQQSVEMELTAILRGAALHNGGASSGDSAADAGGDTTDADDCGSPDLDESLDSHFNYIQRVSAPQELSNLLPRLQATLFKLTDVSLVKQLQQQAAAAAGAGASGGGGGGVQGQLRLLARLCFGRTVAAAFLLPLMDLSVRTKLNIIGRHLFLQEKFSKLRQPAAPAARMRLPPRLTAAAVEAFLVCEQLVERGCEWLVEQAMSAADRVMEGVPLDANVTPEELADMVQAMATCLGEAVTAAAATSPTGCAWVDAVVGPTAAAPAVGADAAAASGSAEAYRRALSNAAMVEELESELRRVLCNYRFGEALHAAVSQCLSTCAAHIHATFISQAAAAQQQQQQQQQQHPAARAAGPPQAEQAPGPTGSNASGPQETREDQLSSHQDEQQQQPRQQEQEGSQEKQRQQQQQRAVSPFSAAASQGCAEGSAEGLKEVESASASAGEVGKQQQGGEQQEAEEEKKGQAEAPGAGAAEAPGAGTSEAAVVLAPAAAVTPQRSGGSGSIGGGAPGGMGRAASLAAAAVAAMQPRPLARCLRAVQGACEPLFVDAREVSARIACLPPVMSLCAVAFAAPLEL